MTINKTYTGGAVPTTLALAMTGLSPGNGDTFTVAADDGWPSSGRFVLVVNRALADEEKILCSSRTGTTFTVDERGYDGTVAQSHAAAATVEHDLDALTITAVVEHVDDPDHLSATNIAGDGLSLLAGVLAVNVDGTGLEISSDNLRIKALGVSTAKLAAGAVTTAKVTDAAITPAKLADDAVTQAKIADDAVGNNEIADGAVATAQLLDGAVTAAKLAAGLNGYVTTTSAHSGITPYLGLLIFETDTGFLRVYDGAAYKTLDGPWTPYTPQVQTGGVNVVLGNGSNANSEWRWSGGLIEFRVQHVLGTTTNYTTAGTWTASLPVAPSVDERGFVIGGATLNDSGTGYTRFAQMTVDDKVQMVAEDGTVVQHNVPIFFGPADFVRITGRYKA